LKVLIAEDERDIALSYKLALERHDHLVSTSYDGSDCIRQYRNEYQSTRDRTIPHREYKSKKNVGKRQRGLVANSKSESLPSPYDVVVLDYKMPGKNGMEVAKEILQINPNQRIIFASAYVIETLKDAVKELNRVVELLQKPFTMEAFVSTIEYNEAYEGLKMLMVNIREIEARKQRRKKKDVQEHSPSDEQIKSLFEGLRKIQKYRTF
jgi:CheY-like chemotaxis protein